MSLNQQREDFYCCLYSRDMGEQLFASATRADVWMLLEYNGLWGNKALPESDLPEPIKIHFSNQLKALPNPQFLFIKQTATTAPGVRFFVAVTRESNPVLYEFHLNSFVDVLSLHIPLMLNGELYTQNIRAEPLYTVCTNGRRDVSCAKFGLPVYQELAREVGENVWQSTHNGGHRFAATMMAFPAGVSYGFVEPGEPSTVVEYHAQGKIYLERCRGRACYEPVVQAAEHFLRQETGILDIDAFKLKEAEPNGEDRWTVTFVSLDGKAYRVQVEQYLSEFEIFKSTADEESMRVPQFRLVELMLM